MLSEFIVLLAVIEARLAAAKPIAVKPSVVVADDEGDIDVSQSLLVLIVLLLLLLLNDDDCE